MRTGLLHKTTGTYIGSWETSTDFNEWRIYMKKGFIRCTFRKSNGRSMKWNSPFDPTIKDDITFTDPTDWEKFDYEFLLLLERQKKKYPIQHKKQKSDTIKNINYRTKHWPASMTKELVRNHTKYLLSICRKRGPKINFTE